MQWRLGYIVRRETAATYAVRLNGEVRVPSTVRIVRWENLLPVNRIFADVTNIGRHAIKFYIFTKDTMMSNEIRFETAAGIVPVYLCSKCGLFSPNPILHIYQRHSKGREKTEIRTHYPEHLVPLRFPNLKQIENTRKEMRKRRNVEILIAQEEAEERERDAKIRRMDEEADEEELNIFEHQIFLDPNDIPDYDSDDGAVGGAAGGAAGGG